MNSFVINNVKVVTPFEVLENGFVYIKKGVIDVIEHSSNQRLHRSCSVIDGQGRWLFPGMVDMFSTALEKELEPTFDALDTKLVSNGITTVCHALSSSAVRTGLMATDENDAGETRFGRLKKDCSIRHSINLVHAIGDEKYFPVVEALINRRELQLISIVAGAGTSFKELDRQQQKNEFGRISDFIELVAEKARKYEIRIASCREGTASLINHMKKLGIKILEFPQEPETAAEAARGGMLLLSGAPSVLRNSGTGPIPMLCSDDAPASMLNAAFALHGRQNMSMAEIFRKLSLDPASALGIDRRLGSIECGKLADLVLVKEANGRPLVEKAFINGFRVYEKNSILHEDQHFPRSMHLKSSYGASRQEGITIVK